MKEEIMTTKYLITNCTNPFLFAFKSIKEYGIEITIQDSSILEIKNSENKVNSNDYLGWYNNIIVDSENLKEEYIKYIKSPISLNNRFESSIPLVYRIKCLDIDQKITLSHIREFVSVLGYDDMKNIFENILDYMIFDKEQYISIINKSKTLDFVYKENFIYKMKNIGYSETFSLLLYKEKIRINQFYDYIQIKSLYEYAKSLNDENISSDMKAYFLLKEYKNNLD